MGSKNAQRSQESQEETSGGRTVVVGIPKQNEEAFMRGMQRSGIKSWLLTEGEKYYKEGKYEEALTVLHEAMKYAEPHNMTAWNIRWQLADVYEAMGKKEEFIDQIDWLITKSKNQKTTQQFIERKNRFLEKYSD